MGSQVSQEERSIVNIWTSLLAKQGIKYDRHQLKALLLSCKSQGIEANSKNAFSVTTWEQLGLLILESDSQGDEIARSVMTTWQVVLDALRMLKKEWDMENQTPADGEGQSGKEGWVEEAGCTPPPANPSQLCKVLILPVAFSLPAASAPPLHGIPTVAAVRSRAVVRWTALVMVVRQTASVKKATVRLGRAVPEEGLTLAQTAPALPFPRICFFHPCLMVLGWTAMMSSYL